MPTRSTIATQVITMRRRRGIALSANDIDYIRRQTMSDLMKMLDGEKKLMPLDDKGFFF